MKRIFIACVTAMMALGGLAVMAQAREHQSLTKLQVSDVPAAVQKVIKQEATQHPLQAFAMSDDDGAKLYEASFSDGQQRIELKIAADGKVVSREVEHQHKEDREEKDD